MHKTPERLNNGGLTLWNEVTSSHELRPDEFRILEDVCREADIIDMMEDLRAAPDFSIYVRGSQGQMVINPLISELRQHRMAVKAMLAQLRLTETAGETQAEVSNKARAAAQARWSRVRAV